MTATSKESASDREILLVGPYGVLGTGVIDAVYRWRQLWNELATFYDLPVAEPLANVDRFGDE